jgi:hypothetical protein
MVDQWHKENIMKKRKFSFNVKHKYWLSSVKWKDDKENIRKTLNGWALGLP